MIKQITLHNFKGHNRNFVLGPATIIVGDNFKGKTGLFQAIALGVHGWLRHPAGDKKLDPYGLASGNQMEVRLELDDQHGQVKFIERTWTQKKNGSVSYSGYDGEPLMPPVLLDARTYFDLSADKRMRFVFGAVKLPEGEFSANKLVADLKNMNADPHTEAHEVALKDVVTQVSESWDAFNYEFTGDGSGKPVQDWLGELIEGLKERAKLAKQAVQRMAQTVAGITELQVRDLDQIDANTAGLEKQMQELRAQISAKNSELGSIKERIKAAEQKQQQIQLWKAEIATLPESDLVAMSREVELQEETQRLIAKGNELSQELGGLEAEAKRIANEKEKQRQIAQTIAGLDEKMVSDKIEEISKLKERLSSLRTESQELNTKLESLRKEHSTTSAELSEMKVSRESARTIVEDAEKKLSTLDTATECPWCHCSGDTFKKTAGGYLRDAIKSGKLVVQNFDYSIERLNQELTRISTAGREAKEGLAEVTRLIFRQEESIQMSEAFQSKRENMLARREELSKQVAPVGDLVAAKSAFDQQQLLSYNVEAVKLNKEALEQIQKMKRAQELAKQIADAPEPVEALKEAGIPLVREIANLEEKVASLDMEVKKSIASKNDFIRQNQALAERDKAQAENDMTKLAVECVTEFQQRLVDQAFGKIITDANRFTDGIMESPLVYREGEIGRMRDGVFVSQEYFSGTESALCFAAISVALAMQSPFRLVQIDEMTRLSRRNKQLVFGRLVSLIEQRVIHQAVTIDTDSTPYVELNLPKSLVTFIQL